LTELGPDEARTPFGDITAEPPDFHPRLTAIHKRSRARHTRPRKIVENRINNYFSGI
jgi:hypothetical protein